MTFYAHSYQSLNCTGAQIPILSRPKICYSFISGSSTLDKRRRGSLAQLEFRGLQSWEHQTREVPDERKSFVSHDSWYVYVPSPWRRKCTVPGLSTETAKCRIVSELDGCVLTRGHVESGDDVVKQVSVDLRRMPREATLLSCKRVATQGVIFKTDWTTSGCSSTDIAEFGGK